MDPTAVAKNRFIPARAGNRPVESRRGCEPSVHPRACGEQSSKLTGNATESGSSPRVRGTGAGRGHVDREARFIPARAGNSLPGRCRRPRAPVHPRACGEQVVTSVLCCFAAGSSPRVRGTGAPHRQAARGGRFIPARAGNSKWWLRASAYSSVHPRACGEQCATYIGGTVADGSSPRVRGTGAARLYSGSTVTVHPRACGEQAGPRRSTIPSLRFIPARAGNRPEGQPRWKRCTVHPRACGEQKRTFWFGGATPGSSPRVRGTGPRLIGRAAPIRFIPARAGNRVGLRIALMLLAVHPRACGEQTSRSRCPDQELRFIPARAGNRYRQHQLFAVDALAPRGLFVYLDSWPPNQPCPHCTPVAPVVGNGGNGTEVLLTDRIAAPGGGRPRQQRLLNVGRHAGKQYRSLSSIARRITGAHCSGPRFFGIQGAPRLLLPPATATSAAVSTPASPTSRGWIKPSTPCRRSVKPVKPIS